MSSAEPTEAEPTAAQPTAAGPAARTGPAVREPGRAPRPAAPVPSPLPGLAESARLLADAATTSTALVADALARIEATQPTLNAFRHLRAEAALAEAAE
ncbi:amidase, partial [Streptomyces sp. SID5466]|nr:amidase [Streptomyces sp. SID5466]